MRLVARVVAASLSTLWGIMLFLPVGFYTMGGQGRNEFRLMCAGLVLAGLVGGALGSAMSRLFVPDAEKISVWRVSLTTATGFALWPLSRVLAPGLDRVGALIFLACAWIGAFAGTGWRRPSTADHGDLA